MSEHEVWLHVRVQVDPNAIGPDEDAQAVAQGIVEQALELGLADMDRQVEADAIQPESEARSGKVLGWSVIIDEDEEQPQKTDLCGCGQERDVFLHRVAAADCKPCRAPQDHHVFWLART